MLTTSNLDNALLEPSVTQPTNNQENWSLLSLLTAQQQLTIIPPANGFLSLDLDARYVGLLMPREVRLFTLSLQEEQQVTLTALSMADIDLFVVDRYDRPVAYDLNYTNVTGKQPQVSFQALGTEEYIIKLVSWNDDKHLYYLEICQKALNGE